MMIEGVAMLVVDQQRQIRELRQTLFIPVQALWLAEDDADLMDKLDDINDSIVQSLDDDDRRELNK